MINFYTSMLTNGGQDNPPLSPADDEQLNVSTLENVGLIPPDVAGLKEFY
jgi:hypothetical protein